MTRRGRPTISDVARRAGVSKGTVSSALNGRPRVAEETRQRILEAARALGWTPSRRAHVVEFGHRRIGHVAEPGHFLHETVLRGA